MAFYQYDDGSSLTTDAAGNPVAVTDYNGNPVPVQTDLLGQVQNLLLGGINQAVRNALGSRPLAAAPAAAVPAGVFGNAGNLLVFAALGIGAVLLVTALK